MPTQISTALMVLAYVVGLPILWTVCFIVIESHFFPPDAEAMLATDILCGIAAIVGWWGIWRTRVRWGPVRKRRTAFLIVATVLGAVGIGVAVEFSDGRDIGFILGPIVGVLSWMCGTAIVWRDTPEDRAERQREARLEALRCPKCRYNMTGLYEARCPECGTQYTLDALLAAALDDSVPRAYSRE